MSEPCQRKVNTLQAQRTRSLEFINGEDTYESFVAMSGQNWTNVRFVQYLTLTAEDDFQNSTKDEVSVSDASPTSNQATGPSTHDNASVGGPLSTIPEGSHEDDAHVTVQDLEEAFGIPADHPETTHLAEAFVGQQRKKTPPVFMTLENASGPSLTSSLTALKDTSIPEWSEVSYVTEDDSFMTECAINEQISYLSRELPMLEDQDEYGAYSALEAYYPECKLLEGVDRLPNSDEHVELRFYEARTGKVVIDRNDDLLTEQEIKDHSTEGLQAMLDELNTWNGFRCFKRTKKEETKCIIDTKWVLKWKLKGGVRHIRGRLCLRGFKESGCDDDTNYSATASRLSQRLLVSETVLRSWTLASTDIPNAFLQGVSYQ